MGRLRFKVGGLNHSNLLRGLNSGRSVENDIQSTQNIFFNNNDDKLEESHLWLDKYKPKNINEIIGHKDEINILKEWLINFK